MEATSGVALTLDPVETRVLGCLIEKRITTPEYYPLTLNSLTTACNQTTNRDPVTAYDESRIERALETLRQKGLIWVVRGNRALKYEHRFSEKLKLEGRELAVMCVLMLRGPQTAGEIRGRTGRLADFTSLEEVDATLENLIHAQPPFARKLPRAPGTKESRFEHVLAGSDEARSEPVPDREDETPADSRAGAGAEAADDGRLARLENEVAQLRGELDELRARFEELESRRG